MTQTRFSWTRAVPIMLLVAGAATASGGFEQFAKRQNNNNNNNNGNLPVITGLTDVVGATSTKASSTSAPATSAAASTTANPTAPAQTDPNASPLPSLNGVGQPALIVPDTSQAPFQQKSALPEGTVFIVVGAVLGFLGACVLAWRGMVAYSLHRSVKRAAHGTYAPDTKSAFGTNNDGYSSMYGTSNVSLEFLSSQKTAYGGAGGAMTHAHDPSSKSAKPRKHSSRNPSQTAASLFFSPTATNGAGTASNRTSSFLPAGYYAAGASALGGPAANGYGRVDSMESGLDSPNVRSSTALHSRPTSSSGNLRQPQQQQQQQQQPQSQPHQRQQSETRRASRYRQSTAPDESRSSLSVGQAPQGRTPSAYMEDLFSEHGYGPRERF